jgi:hypothetical protein
VTPPIERFPRRTWRAGQPLWRIHRAENGAGYFSSDTKGRFNPVGVEGLGACYFAQEPLGAFVEVYRTSLELDEADVDARRLACVEFDRDLRLADLCSRRIREFDLTAEIGAGGDYERSQALASELAAAGYPGVRYLLRHDPKQDLVGIAVFGPAGAPSEDAAELPTPVSGELDEQLLDEARRKFRYRVLPPP